MKRGRVHTYSKCALYVIAIGRDGAIYLRSVRYSFIRTKWAIFIAHVPRPRTSRHFWRRKEEMRASITYYYMVGMLYRRFSVTAASFSRRASQ